MSEPPPLYRANNDGDRTTALFIEMLWQRRRALLMELASIEDFLIAHGRLERRSVVTRQERSRYIDVTEETD